jgi:hypothetical protein
MSVRTALGRASDALGRNPVLFAPVAPVALVVLPAVALRPTSPGLANLASLLAVPVAVLLVPFVQGGLVAMAAEALDGRTSLSTLRSGGAANYASLLAALLLGGVVGAVVGVVVAFLSVFAVFARYPGGAGETGGLVALLLAAVAGVVLAVLLVVAVVQFYAHAVVLDGHGALGGPKHSAALALSNPASVLGYSAVVGAAGAVAVGAVAVATAAADSAVRSGALPGPWAVAGVWVVGGAAVTLCGGFVAAFSGAFYRALARSD